MSKPIFYYVDAPIGSGKTHALVDYLAKTNCLATIGTQTNALSEQYEKDLSEKNLSARVIFRPEEIEDAETDVGEQDVSSAKRYKEGCKARVPNLVVNQEVAGKCADDAYDRDLFNDEYTSPYQRLQIDGYPILQEAVAQFFEPVDDLNTEFVRLRRTDRIVDAFENGWTDSLLRNASDDLKKAIERLYDTNFGVMVNRKDLADFKLQIRGWLSIHVIAMPTRYLPYRSVTYLGANFNDSLLYLVWRNLVDFKPHPIIEAKYHDIRDKKLLVDLYALHERDLSSTLLKEVGRQTYYDACRSAVLPLIGDEKHIFCMNNEKRGERHKWRLMGGKRLSPDPRGINEFKDINIAIHMAALNEHPDTIGFFERFLGVTPEQLKLATTYERIYQFVGRTSIRKKESRDRVSIIVADMGAARFLQSKIGCADPTLLNIGIDMVVAPPKKRGPKTVERTPEEKREYDRLRKQAYREKTRSSNNHQSI